MNKIRVVGIDIAKSVFQVCTVKTLGVGTLTGLVLPST